MNNKFIFLCSVFTLLPSALQAADERDPFVPFVAGSASTASSGNNNASKHKNNLPLERYSIDTYQVIGVMASEKKQIAVISTKDKSTYFVSKNDKIGNEGSVISKITQDGVIVALKDKSDKNSKVRKTIIPVSNKFGIQNDE